MSHKLFIINSIIFGLVFLVAIGFSYLQPDPKYSIYLAFALTISFGLSIAGIILGFQNKNDSTKDKKNKVGLYGNLAYCIIIILLMISALNTM